MNLGSQALSLIPTLCIGPLALGGMWGSDLSLYSAPAGSYRGEQRWLVVEQQLKW